MTIPAPVTETTAEIDESLLYPPQTGRLFTSFQYLRDQIDKYDRELPAHKHARCKWAVDQFLRRLDVEIELFNATLSDLADSYRAADETDWYTVERAIRTRCGAYYGKYLDLVNHLLVTVRGMAELAGVAQDTAPWFQQKAHQRGERVAAARLSVVGPRSNHWQKFVSAICSVNGSLGGQVDVHLTSIWTANEELIGIRRRVQETPPRARFEQLEALRQHAERAAEILGLQNGFSCPHEPHGAFIRIKECFRDQEAGSDDQIRDEVCSLVFHNSSADVPWSWVEMTAETLNSHRLRQPDAEENRSPKTSSVKEPWLKATKASIKKSLRFKGYSDTENEEKDEWVDRPASSSDTSLSAVPEIGLCSFLSSHLSSEKVPDSNGITLSRKNGKYQLRLNLDPSAEGHKAWNHGPVSVQTRYSSSDLLALSTEEKLHLAIKVASSLFYLHSTPWLARSWSADDIYLIRKSGSDEHEGPLLAKQLQQQGRADAPPDQRTDSSARTDPTILLLGRFLVQLWCGAPWDRVRDTFLGSSAERPPMELDADILVISHILAWAGNPTVAEKDRPFYLEGGSYADAVRSCFLCDFGQQTTSLGDEDFRLGVYLRILRPLRYALEDFYALQSMIYGPKKGLNDTSSSHGSQGPQEMQDLMLFDDESLGPDSQSKINSADKWFRDYAEVKKIAQIFRQRPKSAQDRIRVAILDTGVDVSDAFLHRFWLSGQIMYENFIPGGSRSKIPQDDHGHGTYITSILLKVAKNVDVYAARVSEDGKQWNSALVEQALQWAVQQDVHIISISFGFPRIDQSLEPIRRAILQAHAADVLVFAAASNEGNGHPIAFPACLDEVICVSSTDGAGQASIFNPIIRPGKRLCAIGEGVEGSWPRKLNPDGGMVRRAGTSYATPIAAGVAAMVMDCLWSIRGECSYEARTLRSNRGMLAVLNLMLAKGKDMEYLSPWLLFNATKNGVVAAPKGEKGSIWQQGHGILMLVVGTLRNVYG